MAKTQSYTLPVSGIRISKTATFDKSISRIIDEILSNPKKLADFRKNPVENLKSIGIKVNPKDLKRIRPEDLSATMMGGPGPEAALPPINRKC